MDLKHLLIEAKQKVPAFLALMQSENEPQQVDEGMCTLCDKGISPLTISNAKFSKIMIKIMIKIFNTHAFVPDMGRYCFKTYLPFVLILSQQTHYAHTVYNLWDRE